MKDFVRQYDAVQAIHVAAIERMRAAIDAKARAMHAAGTPLVTIGGITYRPKAPRKKRGQPEDAGALWGLERVEIGE